MNLIDLLDVYSLEHDSDNMFLLFNDYILDSRLDKDTMNTIIIKELGASRPLTTDPDLFKILLDTFFKKYNLNITKLINTMYLEYNPLYNKDMHREVDEDEHRHSVGDIDNTDTYTTETDNVQSGTNTSEHTVSAYDSPTYQPKDKTVDTPNLRTDNDVTHSGETTSDIVSTVDTDKGVEEHYYGKDGQDSYQSLIEQERKVSEFNIFNWIIKQMRRELFLLIY